MQTRINFVNRYCPVCEAELSSVDHTITTGHFKCHRGSIAFWQLNIRNWEIHLHAMRCGACHERMPESVKGCYGPWLPKYGMVLDLGSEEGNKTIPLLNREGKIEGC